MIKIYFSFLLLCSLSCFGQWEYTFNFEDTAGYYNFLKIENTPLSTNTWQVGAPQKTIFTQANSNPNVIVTDTMNFYRSNDSSIFEIYQVNEFQMRCVPMYAFSGYYWVNSDTITDFGKIEVSPNHGATWIDIVNDTIYDYLMQWSSEKPTLTGNSNGWQYFYVDLHMLMTNFNIYFLPTDTLIYRFTFISDSVQTQKDGLMFDDLNFHYESGVGIEETQERKLLKLFPNPASEFIAFNEEIELAEIFDSQGRCVIQKQNVGNGEKLDVLNLSKGLYSCKLSDKKGKITTLKFSKL
jgi:hypothetical protein